LAIGAPYPDDLQSWPKYGPEALPLGSLLALQGQISRSMHVCRPDVVGDDGGEQHSVQAVKRPAVGAEQPA
jgi:hypothetical protein